MLMVSFFLLAGSAWAPPQQSVDEIVDHLRPGAWKMLGPLQSRNSKGARALLGNVKHMEAGQPWLGLRESYAGTDSSELNWMPLNLESMRISQDQDLVNPRIQAGLDSGIIDFRSLIPGLPGSKRATYLYRPVYANAESTTDVTFGAAGRLSLWWNGRFIFRRKALTTSMLKVLPSPSTCNQA